MCHHGIPLCIQRKLIGLELEVIISKFSRFRIKRITYFVPRWPQLHIVAVTNVNPFFEQTKICLVQSIELVMKYELRDVGNPHSRRDVQ